VSKGRHQHGEKNKNPCCLFGFDEVQLVDHFCTFDPVETSLRRVERKNDNWRLTESCSPRVALFELVYGLDSVWLYSRMMLGDLFAKKKDLRFFS
jgi:hypothetical protein